VAYRIDDNGNYKRTVRCSYCYEVGHNKGSCPKRKTDIQENIERYTKELAETDHPADSYQVKNVERWLKHAKTEYARMTEKGKRKCKYCGETGHNRRSCTVRKQDVEVLARKTQATRVALFERMKDAGLHVGALVNVRDRWHTNQEPQLALVKKIHWNSITHRTRIAESNQDATQQVMTVELVANRKENWSPLPESILNIDDLNEDQCRWLERMRGSFPDVVSPVDVPATNEYITTSRCREDVLNNHRDWFDGQRQAWRWEDE